MAGIRITGNGAAKLVSGRPVLVTTGAVSPTTLTVTEFTADRIFQRSGTSKAVPVAGTYTGPLSAVQARAVPVGTPLSSSSYSWVDIAATISGGAYSGSLNVPQGGWYTLQVRDAVNSSVTAAGSGKFSVGLLVGLIGQSNMFKLTELVVNYPQTNLGARRFAASSRWDYAGNYDVTGTYPPNTPVSTYGSTFAYPTSGSGDGTAYFVNYLMAALGIPVGTLEYAVNGSSLANWQPGGAQYVTFAGALAASGGDCEAAIFLQGETDANGSTTEAEYKAGLLNLRNALYMATGRDATTFNFGVVVVGPGDTFAPAGRMGAIRKAQLEFIATTPGAYLSSIATDADLAGDPIHFSGISQGRQGKRYALGLAGRLGALPYGAEGPRVTGATRSGAVVTVAIAQNGGTALVDGVGGTTGAGLTGFRIFDNGVLATISSKAISGNNVVLTLSAAPSGPVTLDYAMADAPFGNPMVPAAALYDNRTVPGDTRGVPLQPLAAITVTGA